MNTLPILLLLTGGCDVGEPGGPQAIEITGYLDATRVTWTSSGEAVQAAGDEGAVSSEAWVLLTNTSSGAEGRTRASIDGAFSVWVRAMGGDHLELRAADAVGGEVATHDVVTDRPPFPTPITADAVQDPHFDAVAVVEVAFEAPQIGGHVWAVNRNLDGAVTILAALDDGVIHGGRLHAVPGHEIWLYWVPVEGPESLPFELVVRAADG